MNKSRNWKAREKEKVFDGDERGKIRWLYIPLSPHTGRNESRANRLGLFLTVIASFWTKGAKGLPSEFTFQGPITPGKTL